MCDQVSANAVIQDKSGDNNALTGAVSAGGAEVAAPYISHWLYGETDGSRLTAEQKEMVSAITNWLGATTGALVGQSPADAASGSLLASNAVENNEMASISEPDSNFRRGELRQLQNKYGLNINEIVNKINDGTFVLNKELADYIYSINQDPNLVISINNYNNPMNIILTNRNERGWQPNKANPGNEDTHTARVAYSDFNNWAVFGNVTVSRNRYTGNDRLIADEYDFKMHPWRGRGILRNIETIIGSPRYGGVSYKIHYNGEVKVE